jgi:hypothetical protein
MILVLQINKAVRGIASSERINSDINTLTRQ